MKEDRPEETMSLSSESNDLKASSIFPEHTFGYGDSGDSSEFIGKVIKNKYKIVSLIARGGASNVFRCLRVLIGDQVALKMMFPESVSDPIKMKRFHLEVSTTASIKHPSIVTVHDFDYTEEGLPFIVTELLRGMTLYGEMKRLGRLPIKRAVRIIGPICSAINVAHARGIVHRDLKPSNIVLHLMDDQSEVVKLIDFGIAKQHAAELDPSQSLTEPGLVFGTPAYMSPEHCLGDPLDARSDIYSLGVLLFEMMTGVLPFQADNPTRMMLKHIKDPPPPMRDICPDIPEEIDRIVLRALAKSPDKRFSSAIELADTLRLAAYAVSSI
ncbi:MAG: serine/threonine-protein kinase [Acidobacteriota bacterium]|nr:serine/threonine protein kinase [Blastocatellia bacterium]MDW8412801.1 serine/threonine-protein kinase [Acidobacteriota bacterium]